MSPCARGNFAAEVTFDQGLEEPVVIGQDGKKGEGYPKLLILKLRSEKTQSCLGTLSVCCD